jgi:hypothetical protein
MENSSKKNGFKIGKKSCVCSSKIVLDDCEGNTSSSSVNNYSNNPTSSSNNNNPFCLSPNVIEWVIKLIHSLFVTLSDYKYENLFLLMHSRINSMIEKRLEFKSSKRERNMSMEKETQDNIKKLPMENSNQKLFPLNIHEKGSEDAASKSSFIPTSNFYFSLPLCMYVLQQDVNPSDHDAIDVFFYSLTILQPFMCNNPYVCYVLLTCDNGQAFRKILNVCQSHTDYRTSLVNLCLNIIKYVCFCGEGSSFETTTSPSMDIENDKKLEMNLPSGMHDFSNSDLVEITSSNVSYVLSSLISNVVDISLPCYFPSSFVDRSYPPPPPPSSSLPSSTTLTNSNSSLHFHVLQKAIKMGCISVLHSLVLSFNSTFQRGSLFILSSICNGNHDQVFLLF